METMLSQDLKNAEQKAQYNAYCRKLLGNRQVLVRILKETVEEFKDCTLKEIEACLVGEPEIASVPVLYGTGSSDSPEYVRNEQEVDSIPGEGAFTYDVRFRARTPNRKGNILLYLNVEGQRKYFPGYPLTKRGVFYGCRMISSQYGVEFTGKNYGGIKKVYSIWVCINVPSYLANSIISYSMEQKVLVGNPKQLEAKENYDLIQVIQICLGSEETHEKSLLEMLRVLFSDKMKAADKKKILSSQYDMKMDAGTGKEIDSVCDFADYIEERGLERGLKKGLERGGHLKLITLVCRKLARGKTPEIIAEELEEDINEVKRICEAASGYAPEYDAEKIFAELEKQHAEEAPAEA